MAPKTAVKGDSYIFLESLRHSDNITKIGETEDGRSKLRIMVMTKGNDVEQLNLYYRDGELKKKNMTSTGVYRGVEYYVAEIDVETDTLEYFFEAIDGRVRYFFANTGEYSPKKIEKYTYEIEEDINLEVPAWTKNALWYGVYVDTFKNGDEDNDPIFNEMGPEYFFQPRGRTQDGDYKSGLVEKGLWRSVDALGEFKVSDWNGNFEEEEAYERNIASKYNREVGKNTRRYGGDLQGVMEKLSYLKGMGVEVVNLSSVFYSYSSHKEDVIDYRHVSPDFASVKTKGESEYKLLDIDRETGKNRLGEGLDSSTWKMTKSDKILKELVKKAHSKNMKVVLDVNLNYVSNRFWALKQFMLEGKDSIYRDWFYVENNWDKKVEYKGTSTVGVEKSEDGSSYRLAWIETPKGASVEVAEEIYRWNFTHMEVKSIDSGKNMILVNYDNESYRRYLLDSLKKWVELGVDGYRLGSSMISEELMKQLEKELSSINNEILLTSVWDDIKNADKVSFQARDNYALGSVIVNYVDNTKPLSKDEVESAFYIYSRINTLENVYASPLYLDSKDTDRLFSMMLNLGREYDSLNSPESDYMNVRPDLADVKSINRVKLASLMQLTISGAPYIYYGTEIGMWGADAPYSKKPMLWSTEKSRDERDRYETYEALGRLDIKGIRYNNVRRYVEYPVARNSSIIDHYEKILRFRRKNLDVFKDGRLRFLEVRDEKSGKEVSDILAYERILEDKRIVVVINSDTNSRKVDIYTEGRGEFESLFTDDREKVNGKRLKVNLEGLGSAVYYNTLN